jgi:uncharacterized protein (TIGR03118 family)
MNRLVPSTPTVFLCTVLGLGLSVGVPRAEGQQAANAPPATPLATNQYLVTPLTVNAGTDAPNVDANLVNPWGLTRSSASPWWVSDNGTGLSTLYDGTGAPQSLVVTIPPAMSGSGNMGSPTGTIVNGTQEFAIAAGKPANFLFATEDGTISGWNPTVNATNAVIAVNESAKGASFKGLTAVLVNLTNYPNQTLLYVADFTLGQVEVFDGSFQHVTSVEQRLQENANVPSGYGPFNVQNLGGNLYVTYAKLGSGIDEQDGAGLGRVRVFRPDGRLILELESGSWLNAPWGLAIAPSDFGPYSHSLLVGNFGSGQIAAFNPVTGRFQDFLRTSTGQIVTLPGLWGISPGNDSKAGNATSLYFTAGGADESSGTLGTITALMNLQGSDQ